jgi:deoxyribonuclease V
MLNYDYLSFAETKIMQEDFRKQFKFETPDNMDIKTIAGADISYNKDSTLMFGAIVILSYPNLKLKAYALATSETNFPYRPGYLGFREVPTLLKVWERLIEKPDVVVLDGQGFLHPRRMGIASHFGVLTTSATIGCAKSSLYGFYEEPKFSKNAFSSVYESDSKEHIGYALRTKDNVNPVYISPGYGLTLPKSLEIMKKCIGNYRIPEPTRVAHQIVNEFRLGNLLAGYHEAEPILELF